MMIDQIVDATKEALSKVVEPRFFQSERGYQGRFYCALQHALQDRGLLSNGYILEMEYQKNARHGVSQRPDIVLHIPAEESHAPVDKNNRAVWALKRKANHNEACEDFAKLDEMFIRLGYSFGVFLNIDTDEPFSVYYRGEHRDRLRCVSVFLKDGVVQSTWGEP